MSKDITITLAEPVSFAGKDYSTLTLREPKGADIRSCGYPLKLGHGTAEPIPEAVARLAARCAAVPGPVIDRLAAGDFNTVLQAVLGFFDTTAPETEPETKTAI